MTELMVGYTAVLSGVVYHSPVCVTKSPGHMVNKGVSYMAMISEAVYDALLSITDSMSPEQYDGVIYSCAI